MALAQRDAGDTVHVVTATPGHGSIRSGLDSDAGLPVHRVAARLPAELPVHPRTVHHVSGLLRDLEPDVVHLHTGVVSPFAWGALRAAERIGAARVVTVHSMWGGLSGPAHRWSTPILPWRAAGTVMTAVSQVAADRVHAALGIDVEVLPNGIDPRQWPAVMRDGEPDRVRLITVTRLAPRKRVGALLAVIARSRLRLLGEIEITAQVIGAGPEESRLRRRTRDLGIVDQVLWSGRQDAGSIRTAFLKSDLFVQASVQESFGIAALEARTSGLPVIARSQTGAGEFVVGGVNGRLAATDDGLVDAIVDLARDQPLRRRMRRFNVDTPPQQTWPRILDIAHGLYERARISAASA